VSTILVVDDEPDIRLFVRMTLGIDHHDVVEAANGREALEAVSTHHPDLILLDVMMPEVSGWDALTALKAHDDDRVREIPVVMLTALGSGVDRAKGGIEGAVRYLAKPIGPDELRATVQEALAGGPEPAQRLHAQRRALEDLARLERGDHGSPVPDGPRPRFSGLETARPADRSATASAPDLREAAAGLTPKQLDLLRTVRRAPTVLAAASELSMSRSNVYASLRRIARRLSVRSVTELIEHVRDGRVVD
jgi:DNA-binding response OmpR family regulator